MAKKLLSSRYSTKSSFFTFSFRKKQDITCWICVCYNSYRASDSFQPTFLLPWFQ